MFTSCVKWKQKKISTESFVLIAHAVHELSQKSGRGIIFTPSAVRVTKFRVDSAPFSFYFAMHAELVMSRIVLKLYIAYGASFAQLLVKKMTGLSQVTEL